MKNKTVLISAVGSSLGQELALAFGRAGANLILTARNTQKLKELSAMLEQESIPYIIRTLDACNLKQCESVIHAGIQEFGSIDIVINNASGYLTGSNLEDMDIDLIHGEIESTYQSGITLSKAILSHFKERQSGCILNIASVAGLSHYPSDSPIYDADKAAVIRLSESLHANLQKDGISVLSLIPCSIRAENHKSEQAASYSDVAKVALFQCSHFETLDIQSITLQPKI